MLYMDNCMVCELRCTKAVKKKNPAWKKGFTEKGLESTRGIGRNSFKIKVRSCAKSIVKQPKRRISTLHFLNLKTVLWF